MGDTLTTEDKDKGKDKAADTSTTHSDDTEDDAPTPQAKNKGKEKKDDAPERTPYRDWLVGVLGELKLEPTSSSAKESSGTGEPANGESSSAPARPAGRAAPRGKGVKGGRIGQRLRKELFGDPSKRTAVSDDVRTRINEQVTLGKAQPVTMIGSGGNKLQGNFFSHDDHSLAQDSKPDTTKPVVLFLSGSGGSAEDYGTDIAEFYQKSGASMLAVNYAGYGEYPKGAEIPEPTEESILQDAQAMLQHLLDQGYTSDQIVIHGYSLGGAIAGKLQTHNEASDGDKEAGAFRGLVLDRPMLSSTAGVKGNIDNKAAALLGAAMTRKLVGSMSARKAIAASNSTTPIVLATEEETKKVEGSTTGETKPNTFSITARKLRQQMSGNEDRSVTGLTGTGNHENHADMLTTNGDLLKALLGGGQDTSTQLGDSGPKPADAKRQRDLVQAEIDLHGGALSKLFAQSANLARKAKSDDEGDEAKASLQKLADEAVVAIDALCELREALSERAEPVLQRAVAKAIERGVTILGMASNSTRDAGVTMPVPDATRDAVLEEAAKQLVVLNDFVDSFDELKTERGFDALVGRTRKQANNVLDRLNALGTASPNWAGDRASEVTDFKKARNLALTAIARYETPAAPPPRAPSGLRGVLARVKRPGRTADADART